MAPRAPQLTDEDLGSIALFPLPDVVLFPGVLLPLHVFEPRYRELMSDVLKGSRAIAIPRLRPGFEQEYFGRPSVYEICGAGSIIQDTKLPDGRYNVVVSGVTRVRIVEELPSGAYRRVRAVRVPDTEPNPREAVAAWHAQLVSLCHKIAPYVTSRGRTLEQMIREAPDAAACANCVASAVIADPDERQRLLEELDPAQRMARIVEQLYELLSALQADEPARASELN